MRSLAGYYAQLSSRDQKALKFLLVFLLGCIVVLGIIFPSYRFYSESKQTLLSNQKLLLWMTDNRDNVNQVTANQPLSPKDLPLIQRVSASADDKGITISRLQPEGEQRVRLWLSNTDFNTFIQWLQDLNLQSTLDISTISIDKTNTPGVVNVQALITSGQ